MNIKIQTTDSTDEQIVRGIMDNYPEAGRGNCFQCEAFNYVGLKFEFKDTETGKEYKLNQAKLASTLPLLFSDKWPKGCTPAPASAEWSHWEEWLCRCDATDFDAFVQLACLGEVIYG